MKKNLIGIVAAGLALALAFTGCESGSDSPVKYATDLDNPVTKGSKFTYVANPTSYTPAATATETPTGTSTLTGYDWGSYVDGTLAYNRKSDATTKSAVKGTEVGDVIKTKKSTVVLNSKDNTFSVLDETTSKEVFALVYSGDTGITANASKLYYAQVVTSVTGTAFNTKAIDVEAAAAPAEAALFQAGEVVSYDAAIANIKSALATAKPLYEAKKYEDNPTANKDAIKAYADTVKLLNEQIVRLDALKFSAVKIIVETDAAAKTTTSYLKADGSPAIAPVVATGTAPKAKTGTYKVLSGSYKDGTILVTSFDKETWNDDDGTYVNDGFKGYIKDAYPEPSATEAGSASRKAARTLTISGGTLTAPKVLTATTTAVDPSITWGFFLQASQTKYFDTTSAGYSGKDVSTAATYKSYSYVLKQ